MKMLSITVSALLASVASADVNCCLQHPTCPLGFVETATPCTPEGLQSGTCTTASACCTTITCRQIVQGCDTNADCPKTQFCRATRDTSSPDLFACLTTKECVDYQPEGAGCGGFTLPCFYNRCASGLTCQCSEPTCDAPGTCVKETAPPAPTVVNGCDTNADCPSTQFCRATRDTSSPDQFACLTTKECVDYQPEGAGCGGFTLPCFYNRCASGLTCQCSEPTCDAPGTCVKETAPPAPTVVSGCDTNADCPSTQFCRATRDTSSPDRFACLTTKECVDYQPEGAGCGGFTLPCFYNRCASGLTCQCSEPTCDAPGTCVKETAPPAPTVVSGCDTNADCPSTQFCRATRDTSSPDRFACLTTKECVDYQPEGAGCGGFTLPCFYNRCASGLTCQCSEPTCDAPGTCVKETPPTPPTPSFCSAQGPTCGTGFDACKPGYTCTVDPTCQGPRCQKCCVRDEEPCCPAPLSCPAGYGAVEGTDALICRIDMLLALLTGSTSACVEVTDQKQDGCCEDVICRKQAMCGDKASCTASTGCTARDHVCVAGSDGASCCVFNQCVLMDCGDQKRCMLDSEGRGQCI